MMDRSLGRICVLFISVFVAHIVGVVVHDGMAFGLVLFNSIQCQAQYVEVHFRLTQSNVF